MNSIEDKREYQRKRARWPVVLTSDTERIRGETRNISGGGVCICCEKPLGLGKRYYLSVKTPSGVHIETKTVVVWTHFYCMYKGERGWGMGGSFVSIMPEDQNFLKNWALNPTD